MLKRPPIRTCDDDLCFKVGLFEPLDSLFELFIGVSQQRLTLRMASARYLGVAPLVGEVARVDQDIALGQLDSCVVGVADAHDAGSPRGAGRGWW